MSSFSDVKQSIPLTTDGSAQKYVKTTATNITGTVAKPSRPSVRFTALDEPTITNTEKGIKNQPRFINKSLKKGKYKFFNSEKSEI